MVPSTKMIKKYSYQFIHLSTRNLILPNNVTLPRQSLNIGLKIILYYFPTQDVQINACAKIPLPEKILNLPFAYFYIKSLIHYAYCSADRM